MHTENAPAAQAIRSLAQKLDALDHEVHSLHDRSRLMIEELGAKLTEVTNRRLYTLSILTACFLPPTLVTGFFGMNTKDMLLQQTEGGTYIATFLLIASSALTYWALRRLRAF
jgi:zinc transporter